MIERTICIGLITSTDFIQQVKPIWDSKFLVSVSAKRIALWCLEYFDEFNKAPGKTISDIFFEKLRTGDVPKDQAEEIEDSLADLSQEFTETFNLEYALRKSNEYFKERHLQLHNEQVSDLMDSGEITAAETLARSYIGLTFEISNDLDLSDPNALLKVKSSFVGLTSPVLTYPGPLGEMLNSQMIPGGFVAFMGSEKRGKSFWLLDMAIRAAWKGSKVAFFQAGDMTEAQQLRRIASYLSKKPIDAKSLGERYTPIIDCVKNQLDICTKPERECSFGPFGLSEKWDAESIRDEITRNHLVEAFADTDGYKPCRNCTEFTRKPLGIPWVEKVQLNEVLTEEMAIRRIEQFFIKKKRGFRLSTHANGTLSVETMAAVLDKWDRVDNFIPEFIAVDYADLMITNKVKEFRHQQNQIWRDLRGLSQTQNCLLATVTQADAKAYDAKLLNLSNFSEDKRKYAHVTAMYGLNQDKGREKKLGILRINEMVVREAEFDIRSTVSVLQDLTLGRPFLGSYY